MISNSKLQEQFKLTDIYADLHNFKNMTQLALSSKIPKWKKVFDKKNIDAPLKIKQHLKKWCKLVEEPMLFIHDRQQDAWGNYRDFRTHRIQFWNFYKQNAAQIWTAAKDHYLATKEAHDEALKIHKAEHQNTEVACPCGGKYSLRNKLKHFATQKHATFCAENYIN